MCGILYSHDAFGFTNFDMLKRRGPEGFSEHSNHLGYFVHTMLHTIGEKTDQPLIKKHGVLLYNGSIYNSGNKNDTNWLFQQLDENLENNLDVIRSLNGEFALIYVTEKYTIFCTDQFSQRDLWFYHNKESKEITISSVPNIVKQKHDATWRVFGENIYVLDHHNFDIDLEPHKIFDLEQTVDHFDYVFETFEHAIASRHNSKTCMYLLSSGWDSGVIACASHKLFNNIECVTDPDREDFDVLKKRIQTHESIMYRNYEGVQEDRKTLFNEVLAINDIWDDPIVDPTISILKNVVLKKSKKILITGDGGDEIYNDYHFQESGFKYSKSNGSFPSSLKLVWPWYNSNERLLKVNIRMDLMCGYFGIEVRNPLLDTNLVQAWLHTTNRLKNKYKAWMKIYMDENKYPYSLKKSHWGYTENEFLPESWKIKKKTKYFYS